MSQEDGLEDPLDLPEAKPDSPAAEAAPVVMDEIMGDWEQTLTGQVEPEAIHEEAQAAADEAMDDVEQTLTGQDEPEAIYEEPIPEQERAAAVEIPEPAPGQPEPAPIQAAAGAAPEKTRNGGCLRLFLVGLLSILGGALLTLLILWLVNGTLDLRKASERAIRAEAFRLDGEMSLLSAEIGQLRDRVQGMEGMAAELDQAQTDIQVVKDGLLGMETRLQGLETDLAAARADVTELEWQAGVLTDRLESMSEQLREVRQAAERFDVFLNGLRQLLNASPGQPPLPSAAPATSTPASPRPSPEVTPGPRITVIPLTTPTPTLAP